MRHGPEYERHRNAQLIRYYGITLAEYRELLAIQKGCCAICGREPTGRALHVDHDHKTGDVRGLLCWTCNRLLPFLGDSPERAARAAAYLRAKPFRRGTAVRGPARPPSRSIRVAPAPCGVLTRFGDKCARATGHAGPHRKANR